MPLAGRVLHGLLAASVVLTTGLELVQPLRVLAGEEEVRYEFRAMVPCMSRLPGCSGAPHAMAAR